MNRPALFLALLSVLNACGQDSTGSSAPSIQLLRRELTYSPATQDLRLTVVALSPQGPVALACDGSASTGSGTFPLHVSGTDSVAVLLSLVGYPRGVSAHALCAATNGTETRADSLALVQPAVPDSHPVRDTLWFDTAGARILHAHFTFHDDWRVWGYSVYYNTAPMLVGGLEVAQRYDFLTPTMTDSVLVTLPDTGTFWVLVSVRDDAGSGLGVWRGPFAPP